MFCELPVRAVSLATGVSETRITDIETGRRQPNEVEKRLIESYLRDRLRMVLDSEGPVPAWLSENRALTKAK